MAKSGATDQEKPAEERKGWSGATAGAAVGIGSAAIVAALLYVNRKPSRGKR